MRDIEPVFCYWNPDDHRRVAERHDCEAFRDPRSWEVQARCSCGWEGDAKDAYAHARVEES